MGPQHLDSASIPLLDEVWQIVSPPEVSPASSTGGTGPDVGSPSTSSATSGKTYAKPCRVSRGVTFSSPFFSVSGERDVLRMLHLVGHGKGVGLRVMEDPGGEGTGKGKGKEWKREGTGQGGLIELPLELVLGSKTHISYPRLPLIGVSVPLVLNLRRGFGVLRVMFVEKDDEGKKAIKKMAIEMGEDESRHRRRRGVLLNFLSCLQHLILVPTLTFILLSLHRLLHPHFRPFAPSSAPAASSSSAPTQGEGTSKAESRSRGPKERPAALPLGSRPDRPTTDPGPPSSPSTVTPTTATSTTASERRRSWALPADLQYLQNYKIQPSTPISGSSAYQAGRRWSSNVEMPGYSPKSKAPDIVQSPLSFGKAQQHTEYGSMGLVGSRYSSVPHLNELGNRKSGPTSVVEGQAPKRRVSFATATTSAGVPLHLQYGVEEDVDDVDQAREKFRRWRVERQEEEERWCRLRMMREAEPLVKMPFMLTTTKEEDEEEEHDCEGDPNEVAVEFEDEDEGGEKENEGEHESDHEGNKAEAGEDCNGALEHEETDRDGATQGPKETTGNGDGGQNGEAAHGLEGRRKSLSPETLQAFSAMGAVPETPSSIDVYGHSRNGFSFPFPGTTIALDEGPERTILPRIDEGSGSEEDFRKRTISEIGSDPDVAEENLPAGDIDRLGESLFEPTTVLGLSDRKVGTDDGEDPQSKATASNRKGGGEGIDGKVVSPNGLEVDPKILEEALPSSSDADRLGSSLFLPCRGRNDNAASPDNILSTSDVVVPPPTEDGGGGARKDEVEGAQTGKEDGPDEMTAERSPQKKEKDSNTGADNQGRGSVGNGDSSENAREDGSAEYVDEGITDPNPVAGSMAIGKSWTDSALLAPANMTPPASSKNSSTSDDPESYSVPAPSPAPYDISDPRFAPPSPPISNDDGYSGRTENIMNVAAVTDGGISEPVPKKGRNFLSNKKKKLKAKAKSLKQNLLGNGEGSKSGPPVL